MAKNDPKYIALKARILREMESVDGPRIFFWAEKAFRQGYYPDVVALSKPGLKRLAGTQASTKFLSYSAHAALYTGDDDSARSQFSDLVAKHSGTSESLTALFRLGLIDYRKKDYISSAAQFERLLVLPGADTWELQTRYWLWRALQKIDPNKAKRSAQDLIGRFPLTYYGLRAKGETSEDGLSIELSKNNLESEIELTPPEKAAWDRLQLLLKSGWFEEAQLEMKNFFEPTTPQSKVLVARYWASALQYPQAIKLINQAWDEDLPRTLNARTHRKHGLLTTTKFH